MVGILFIKHIVENISVSGNWHFISNSSKTLLNVKPILKCKSTLHCFANLSNSIFLSGLHLFSKVSWPRNRQRQSWQSFVDKTKIFAIEIVAYIVHTNINQDKQLCNKQTPSLSLPGLAIQFYSVSMNNAKILTITL